MPLSQTSTMCIPRVVKDSLLSCVRPFATPWTAAHQAVLSMGFPRQECWNGLPFPSPEDLPNPGIEPGSPASQADSLPPELPGKPQGDGVHWSETMATASEPIADPGPCSQTITIHVSVTGPGHNLTTSRWPPQLCVWKPLAQVTTATCPGP